MNNILYAPILILLLFVLSAVSCDKPQTSVGASSSKPSQSPVIIMTAASAGDLMTEIAANFNRETGIEVRIVPGGSNALATQILADAPADLFLSANLDWANKVAEKGHAAKTTPLLTNDLVLIVPTDNPGAVNSPVDLTKDKVLKIALAGDNVPCGKYAKQALEKMRIYDDLMSKSKIVRGQDVRVALSYVEQSEAEAGVVYSTDAKISKKVKTVFQFDPNDFEAIVYPLILLKTGEANSSAVQFQTYLLSSDANAVFLKYGFKRIPAESPK